MTSLKEDLGICIGVFLGCRWLGSVLGIEKLAK